MIQTIQMMTTFIHSIAIQKFYTNATIMPQQKQMMKTITMGSTQQEQKIYDAL